MNRKHEMQDGFDFDALPSIEDAAPTWNAPISVSELTTLARELLERGIPLQWIAGEISNLTRAASGHCYFSLKDKQAQVRCVMFRSRSQHLDWSPANGMQVEVRARASLYEARGEFQLTIDFMRRAGLGALFEAFARLKTRLEQEGLFEPARKRPLPPYPRRIGIVTSLAAAALRDVLTTLKRRMPSIPLVIYPTPVQGDGSAQRIVGAIEKAASRNECDVLILCRGGGSIEDLWSFNEEIVARAIARSAIPVVCGVGHETDFTIADFVADARAPTPTGAAELATPDGIELAARLRVLHARMRRAMVRMLERRMQQGDYLARRLIHPGERIEQQRRQLTQLAQRLSRAQLNRTERHGYLLAALRQRAHVSLPPIEQLQRELDRLRKSLVVAPQRMLERHELQVRRAAAHLNALNPQLVLERGYAIVATTDGRIVRSASEVAAGDAVALKFARGAARARIEKSEP